MVNRTLPPVLLQLRALLAQQRLCQAQLRVSPAHAPFMQIEAARGTNARPRLLKYLPALILISTRDPGAVRGARTARCRAHRLVEGQHADSISSMLRNCNLSTQYFRTDRLPHLLPSLEHDLICRIQRCSSWHVYVSLDPISYLTLFIYLQTVCDNVSHHRLPLIQTAASPTSTVPRTDLHGWSKSKAPHPVYARHGLMM